MGRTKRSRRNPSRRLAVEPLAARPPALAFLGLLLRPLNPSLGHLHRSWRGRLCRIRQRRGGRPILGRMYRAVLHSWHCTTRLPGMFLAERYAKAVSSFMVRIAFRAVVSNGLPPRKLATSSIGHSCRRMSDSQFCPQPPNAEFVQEHALHLCCCAHPLAVASPEEFDCRSQARCIKVTLSAL